MKIGLVGFPGSGKTTVFTTMTARLSYEKPGASMQKVDRWIGFWDEVEVVAG